MASKTLSKLLRLAKKRPGKLTVLSVSALSDETVVSQLKLFAEGSGYGGVVLYAVSPDFHGKKLYERSDAVWRLLDQELSGKELNSISHLFAFTPKEFTPNLRKVVAHS